VLPLQRRPAAQATPDQAARFGARTEAVVVDVTVVDKKGRPVTTLAQSDFEVFEDGVPQTILTFDRHAPNPNATAEDAAAELGLGGQNRASRKGRSITAIARSLPPEGRMPHARRSGSSRTSSPTSRGVFIVDQALRTLAPHTTIQSSCRRLSNRRRTPRRRNRARGTMARIRSRPRRCLSPVPKTQAARRHGAWHRPAAKSRRRSAVAQMILHGEQLPRHALRDAAASIDSLLPGWTHELYRAQASSTENDHSTVGLFTARSFTRTVQRHRSRTPGPRSAINRPWYAGAHFRRAGRR
jgi:hypothetical protein